MNAHKQFFSIPLITRTSTRIVIPDGITFDSLLIAPNRFEARQLIPWKTVEAICEASGLDIGLFISDPEGESDDYANLVELLFGWYRAHLDAGGVHVEWLGPDPGPIDLAAA